MLSGGGSRAGLGGGAAMELGERLEALREPADDRERHRQAERPRTHGRLRRASDGDPHGKWLLHRRREHRVARCRGSRVADVQQLRQLLLEQPVVVAEVEAEERKRLDEGPAPDHHLGASGRQEIERRELLVQADRDRRAEHRHRARQPDALRARCGGGKHDSGSRHCELGAVVLSDPEDVETDLVGELHLFHEIA